MKTIAIDYDHTFTADSVMFRLIIELMRGRNHTVIIATGRNEFSEDMRRDPIPDGIPIVYCGNEYKSTACEKQGYKVDIWIDDMPAMITPSLLTGADDAL
jgi:hypothetical protein